MCRHRGVSSGRRTVCCAGIHNHPVRPYGLIRQTYAVLVFIIIAVLVFIIILFVLMASVIALRGNRVLLFLNILWIFLVPLIAPQGS